MNEDPTTSDGNRRVWLNPAIAAIVSAIVTGVVAYVPLSKDSSGLALSLTAAAAVSYTVLTFSIAVQATKQAWAIQHQVNVQRNALADERETTAKQLALQQESLNEQRRALEQTNAQFVSQVELSQSAAKSAAHSLTEGIKARYDSTAPNVAMFLADSKMTVELQDGKDENASWPSHLEDEQLDQYRLRISAVVRVENYGPSPALLRVQSPSFGSWLHHKQGESRLIPPSAHEDLEWGFDGTVRTWASIAAGNFGVRCQLIVDDLRNNVRDTHHVIFTFTIVQRDGSRVALSRPPVAIASEGAATVVRKYGGEIDGD